VEVLQDILEKLKQVSGQEITLRKYIRQLSLLARLRNLTKETQNQINESGMFSQTIHAAPPELVVA
jgi:hypothetical protein